MGFFTTKRVQLRLADTAIVRSTTMIVAQKDRKSAGMCRPVNSLGRGSGRPD